jgi:hypothetical protein
VTERVAAFVAVCRRIRLRAYTDAVENDRNEKSHVGDGRVGGLEDRRIGGSVD